MNEYVRNNSRYPDTESEVLHILRQNRIDSKELLDPWNRRYKFIFSTILNVSNKTVYQIVAQYGKDSKSQMTNALFNQLLGKLIISCSGPDGMEGNADDFRVADFNYLLKEGVVEEKDMLIPTPMSIGGSRGVITGIVLDMNGAKIPGATIKIKDMAHNLI